ncbi:hypothetical protein TTHERM_00942630 (macronuclear) [Tetrahymena thermophila SB210]|uniref:Armadillo-type fold n=1 Tax=Tetrahymena thermophila (strain SB210) TaxID=312017 RepID=Q22DL6_TETTS|nr:hypothetical protein TTHERM_00942630 [Tetrahymena thermophila SB210]EAR83342.1 hypothetical protein TTHERM_00942630 [Tetrahymena thermophila SB210]|eukprot:XP_001031005.1 hypothetical protein TTHERM_00942630 [Tetrahymena thermophila SB210]
MQVEQHDDQKTIAQYREEHSNNFRNELRNKFIQKSREKHLNRNNISFQNNDLNNYNNANNQYSQIPQQQQQQLFSNFLVDQNNIFQNAFESQRQQNQNLSNLFGQCQNADYMKMGQDVIIEEGNSSNNGQIIQSIDFSQQNRNNQYLNEVNKFHNESNQSIQYLNFQGSVQALLNNNDANLKVAIMQHITDLIENNLQDLMDFSYILQSHCYLLDIVKQYIEHNQKQVNLQINKMETQQYNCSSSNHSKNNILICKESGSSSSNTASLHELEQIDSNGESSKIIWAINLISLIAYTKQESVNMLIKKGFVDLFMNIFTEQNQNIKIAEKIISFFANVISVDEVMKTYILTNIPIKLFLFFFINNEYHHPSFLDFHQILSLFLNKCYLQSDYMNLNSSNQDKPNSNGVNSKNDNENQNSQEGHILQTLNFIFNSVTKDFLEALQNFINDTQVSINLSEILTYICSNILKTYPFEMIKQHINEIKQLIQLQIKSGIKPLQIQSIKLMIKIFQIPHLLQEFDDEAKNFMVQTLKDSMSSEFKQIRINSMTAIISLLQNIQDDNQYTHIIQYLYINIFNLFENDHQQIKTICLNFFQSLINHCANSQNVTIDWKLKMGDQILVSLISQLRKCSVSVSNIDFISQILNLLQQIISILNSNIFKYKFQLDYLQQSGLLEALKILQQQDISFEIKNQSFMILQQFYNVQNQK